MQVAGDGPPVLFIHGSSSSGVSWAPLVARMSSFRCLVLDRPGCGLSDPIAGGRKITEIEEFRHFVDGFLPDLLRGLEVDRAHLVCTSGGAYFALRGAAAQVPPTRTAPARRFVGRFPDASLELLPEAGHAPWIDEQDTCARLATEFLTT